MGSKYPQASTLNITTKNKNGKTIIDQLYFTPPFKITKPFKQKEGGIHIIVMMASAGIMEGDSQSLRFEGLENSRTWISSQSYEKVHKMHEEHATRHSEIIVHSNAYLKYQALATIPFKDSAFESTTRVVLSDESSKFSMTDIITCGRKARGEEFEYKFYKNRVEVERAGDLLYMDNTVFIPEELDMKGLGMMEGNTHLANVLLFNFNITDEQLKDIRNKIDDRGFDGGATRMWSNDVVLRIFGENADSLLKLADEITEDIENTDRF